MGRLDGRVALISGSGRGMGATAARLFASEGAKVVLGDVLVDEARVVAKDIGEQATAVSLDVTSEADWESAVGETTAQFGQLDVLVNNAGIFKALPLMATSLEDYRQTVDVNQVGVFLGMKAVVAPMVAAGGGSIVNISSIIGIRGQQFAFAYGASKFAVCGMTKVAALELASAGIRVNSVHPGYIDTAMLSAGNLGIDFADVYDVRQIPGGRMGRPEEVARVVLFLASEESSYCTGAEFVVDAGVTATVPGGTVA